MLYYFMKIDSCRKCGEELEIQKKCSSCNEPITFQCVQCDLLTDTRFHFQCDVPLLKVQIGR